MRKSLKIAIFLMILTFIEATAFAGEDSKPEVQFGGRIQNDWAFVDESMTIRETFGEHKSGSELRRIRIFAKGTVAPNIEFKFQVDFAGGDAKLKDAYIGFNRLPYLGHVRIGLVKEPFSLEESTSSKYITFLERALPVGLAPSRNQGIRVGQTVAHRRVTWAAGVFRDTSHTGEARGSAYHITGRVTVLPLYLDGGEKLFHVGVGYSFQNPEDNVLRVRQRPEVHLAGRLIDTGALEGVKDYQLFGLEGALVFGRFSVQSEYIVTKIDAPTYDDPLFKGYYVYASFFLTPGDRRRYAVESGSFGRVRPNRSVGKGGIGAIEVAIRYSTLDLNSGRVQGGQLRNLTFALNWYLNARTRVMMNYIHADRVMVGTGHYFLARFQVDF